jgi:hypothetical protein
MYLSCWAPTWRSFEQRDYQLGMRAQDAMRVQAIVMGWLRGRR